MKKSNLKRLTSGFIKTDCGIIGAGISGCVAALDLADSGRQVDVFVKRRLIEDNNSFYIAGGLAAVSKQATEDSVSQHIKDTLEAGKQLNSKKIVKLCSHEFFSEVIKYLESKGVSFDSTDKKYDLNKEGGHSANRIVHRGDTTGEEIMHVLGGLLLNHPNIRVHEYHIAIDLIRKKKISTKSKDDECLGFYVFDINNKKVKTIHCKGSFIATGGLGKVFLYTSNSDTNTGDGFAMAYRAGLKLTNMEFVQFHPTVYYDPCAQTETERRFLLTEALRGAGAVLTLSQDSHEDFVKQYDPQGSQATRDVVVLAEDIEMRKHGLVHVWLDCTPIGKNRMKKEFPKTWQFCVEKGIDPSIEPIPVVYAAHYSNGGVLVNASSETSLKRCYVIGETAYTGLHGATRLAGNSAPECVLFARKAAEHFLERNDAPSSIEVPPWDVGEAVESKDKITVGFYWEIIRRTMNALCGISRNKHRLEAAFQLLESLKESINQYYWTYHVEKDFLEVRNIADAALVIIESALSREESRASHFREDFPQQNNQRFRKISVVQKGKSTIFKEISP